MIFKTDGLIPRSSAPITIAVGPESVTSYKLFSVFSVAATVVMPLACSKKIASFIWSTLQIGMLKTAPAEVFTVSPFTGAEPDF